MMNSKLKTLSRLQQYFQAQGKVFTYAQYLKQPQTPIRAILVKRSWGSWARMQQARVRKYGAQIAKKQQPKKPEAKKQQPKKPQPKKPEVKK